jgi:uncharacterized protein YutE (UPF0331/DUF86 family)
MALLRRESLHDRCKRLEREAKVRQAERDAEAERKLAQLQAIDPLLADAVRRIRKVFGPVVVRAWDGDGNRVF